MTPSSMPARARLRAVLALLLHLGVAGGLPLAHAALDAPARGEAHLHAREGRGAACDVGHSELYCPIARVLGAPVWGPLPAPLLALAPAAVARVARAAPALHPRPAARSALGSRAPPLA